MYKLTASILSLFPKNKIQKIAELAVLKKQLRKVKRRLAENEKAIEIKKIYINGKEIKL